MTLTAVLIASLLGSPHCVGMCGGFVAFYSTHSSARLASHTGYSVGRWLAYALLGALAGSIGSGLNTLSGIEQLSSIIVAIVLIIMGVQLVAGSGFFMRENLLPRPWRLKIQALHRFMIQRLLGRPLALPFVLGFFSALLPCGWLYSYVLIAAGGGSALQGIVVMSIFWLGTLPMLLGAGHLLGLLGGSAKRFVPLATAAILIAAGLWSLEQHMELLSSSTHCN